MKTESNEPCCPALTYSKLVGCRFCSLQFGGPSRLCLDMQKVYEDVSWLLDQTNTIIGFLSVVGIANEIIDKAYDKAIDEYFREKRSE